MKTEIQSNDFIDVLIAAIFGYIFLAIIAFAFVKIFNLGERTYLMPLIVGNTGNLGFPLCLFAFGDPGFGYAIIVFALTSIVAFTIGIWVIAGEGSPMQILKEPLVMGTILGLIFMWRGWETPEFLTSSLELIGQMAIPMMLLTLGVAVARLEITDVKKSFLISLCKILFGVTAAVLVSFIFDLPKVAIAVLILQFSMPVAVTSYLLAEKYRADANAVAGLVVVSTLITVGISPILIAFLIT
jgi:predicted permease